MKLQRWGVEGQISVAEMTNFRWSVPEFWGDKGPVLALAASKGEGGGLRVVAGWWLRWSGIRGGQSRRRHWGPWSAAHTGDR